MDDRRDYWIRPLTLALLGLLLVGMNPRAAHAIGCHAPDRPTLGLPILGEAIEHLRQPRVENNHRAASILIVRGFCTGDVPAPGNSRIVPGGSHAAIRANEVVRADNFQVARFDSEPFSPIRSIDHSSRVDRPPRLLGLVID